MFFRRSTHLMIFALIIVFLISGCGSVKSMKFTSDNVQQVMDEIGKSKDLTGEEHSLLLAAMIRYKMQKSQAFEGKTVSEVIAEQRKLKADYDAQEAEKKRLADEAKKKAAAIAAELSQYLIVTPTNKGFREKNIYSGQFEDYILFTFAFQNKGSKDIRAFRGNTAFSDLFGEPIYSTNLTYDEGIKAGQTKTWEGSVKYNQFIEQHSRLKNKNLDALKFVWTAKSILFADGTTIGETN